MQNNPRPTRPNKKATRLAVIMIALLTSLVLTTQAQTSYVPSLPISDTRAPEPSATPPQTGDDTQLRRACAEAVEELRAGRKLLASQDVEIRLQGELLALEKEISAGLKNLRNLDESEKQALRAALDAKDRQIAALDAVIVELKKRRFTFWKKIKTFAVGAAAGIVIGALVLKK